MISMVIPHTLTMMLPGFLGVSLAGGGGGAELNLFFAYINVKIQIYTQEVIY